MSQLDRLPTMHQMYLKVASVLGVVFEKETLRAIYPIEEGVGLVNVSRSLLCFLWACLLSYNCFVTIYSR